MKRCDRAGHVIGLEAVRKGLACRLGTPGLDSSCWVRFGGDSRPVLGWVGSSVGGGWVRFVTGWEMARSVVRTGVASHLARGGWTGPVM
jgi:hypothetical protein